MSMNLAFLTEPSSGQTTIEKEARVTAGKMTVARNPIGLPPEIDLLHFFDYEIKSPIPAGMGLSFYL